MTDEEAQTEERDELEVNEDEADEPEGPLSWGGEAPSPVVETAPGAAGPTPDTIPLELLRPEDLAALSEARFAELADFRAEGGETPGLVEVDEGEAELPMPAWGTMTDSEFRLELAALTESQDFYGAFLSAEARRVAREES